MNTRDGTDVDAKNVENTFGKLGYKVKVHHDQTVAQMKKLMLDGKKSFGHSCLRLCGEQSCPCCYTEVSLSADTVCSWITLVIQFNALLLFLHCERDTPNATAGICAVIIYIDR